MTAFSSTANTTTHLMHGPVRDDWKPLRFFNYYRLILAGLFFALFFLGNAPKPLGQYDARLFQMAISAYLLLSIVFGFTTRWQQPSFNVQVYAQVLVDIVCLTLLVHASHIGSGLGMLLIISVAGGSLLMPGRTAILFAAIAALAVLGEQIYTQIQDLYPPPNYTHAGALGAAYFATAILAYRLATRIRESEALAARRGEDLAGMAQLNEHIIQRMQAGIMFVDHAGRIRLLNESAQALLGLRKSSHDDKPVDDVSLELASQLREWRENPDFESFMFRSTPTAPTVLPKFADLGGKSTIGTLIFLEDTAAMTQQAQQMKLASLGRLTASIAHEIRNPLAAISHAGQLLEESPRLESGDLRLAAIIRKHTRRMNDIVENILQLSRRDRANPEVFKLAPWLEEFIDEFVRSYNISAEQISLHIDPEDTEIRIDPNHLHQVVWNLCQNGLRHSSDFPDNPKVELRGGRRPNISTPFLDMIDHGPGIEPEIVNEIFDPFFTTTREGTGLGLYIARELCESNQARLDHVPMPTGGTCFRITFADPRRKQVALQ